MKGDQYFIVKKKAVPEVLLKVVEAKRLLDSERVMTVQEATDAVDISEAHFISIAMTSSLLREHQRENHHLYASDG